MGAAEEALLCAAAQAVLPAGIGFTLRRVDAIPARPGGKARPFVALAGSGSSGSRTHVYVQHWVTADAAMD